MKMHWFFTIYALLTLIVNSDSAFAAPACGAGQSSIGGTCVYKNVCPDGRAKVNGICIEKCWDGKPYSDKCMGLQRWSGRPGIDGHDVDSDEARVRDCEMRSMFYGLEKIPKKEIGETLTSVPRRVLLVNGNARNLFVRFVSDLKTQGGSPELSTVTVICYESEAGRQEYPGGDLKLKLGESIAGITVLQKWRKRLGGKTCEDAKDAVKLALNNRADLICGPKVSNP